MELAFVRHGESEANRAGIIQGRGDYPLSDIGREQARLASAALAGFGPSIIFSSPLVRARETAEIINRAHGVEIIAMPELQEYNLGEFEGKTFQAVLEGYPEVKPGIARGVPFHHLAPGAETDAEADGRAARAIELLLGSGADRAIVVAHLGILERIVLAALNGNGGIPASAWPLNNASITRLRLSATERRLLSFNETGHLS